MGRAKGAKGKQSLEAIKVSYKNARDVGDKDEEAKWANQIGHAYKDRGEYLTALKWFRKDYEISTAGRSDLSSFKLMPTCQSLGEVYLRLQNYDEALTYQKKHFHLAQQCGDLVEQQRASTQLGRTYLELYEIEDRLSALPAAEESFKTSLDLARRLRTSPPTGETSPSAYVLELVDVYNNLGLARTLAEDHGKALEYYQEGLKLCDDEEVGENDAARSRIHHNLGRVYSDLREWDKAKEHTQIDIEICQRIPHAQGEAKGLVNLADVHFKTRDYEQATRCYKRALQIAQGLEDEDNLCRQIKGNLEVADQAKAKSKSFDVDMQKLSKVRRELETAKGTAMERNYIKQECKLLHELISQADELQAWDVHLGLAKRLKRSTRELGDNERLGDALEIVAVSYYNLRNFRKSVKWHKRSFELCQRIGHLEGQIVAKINCGNALDAWGRSEDALAAYKAAYEAAKRGDDGKMLTQQINALENIHYTYFVRLRLVEDARKAEFELQQLKHSQGISKAVGDDGDERCSETGSEGSSEDEATTEVSVENIDAIRFQSTATGGRFSNVQSQRSNLVISDSEDDDNSTLSSLLCRKRPLREMSSNASPGNCSELLTKQGPRKSKPATKVQERVREMHTGQGSYPKRMRFGARRKRVVSDNEMSETSSEIEVPSGHASKPAKQRGVVDNSDSGDFAMDVAEIQLKRRTRPAKHGPSLETEVVIGQASKLAREKNATVEDSGSEDCSIGAPDIWLRRQTQSARKHSRAENLNLSSEEKISQISRKKFKRSSSPSRPSASTQFLSSPLQDLEDIPGGCHNDSMFVHDVHSPLKTRNVPEYASINSVGTRRSVCVEVPNVALKTSDGTRQPRSTTLITKYAEKLQDNSTGIPLVSTVHRAEPLSTADSSQLNGLVGTGTPLTPVQAKEDLSGYCHDKSVKLGVYVGGRGNTPLLERYLMHCRDSGTTTNSLLVEALQSQKVSEEVVVAGCNIGDNGARPLLAALEESDAFSVLDMSHNLLGNATVHAVQELIKSTNQTDLGLTLDLHSNKLGAGALLQICRCPVSLSRLEVLNLSDNRLTDAAARHLSKILNESQALATLNLESCALTTRSIKQLTAALHPDSSLIKLSIGKNNPIAGVCIQELLHKLSLLTSLSELDIKSVELDDAGVAGVSSLLQESKSISTLILGGTDIRNDGALAISDALDKTSLRLVKFDVSRCGFNLEPAAKLCSRLFSSHSLSDLNLSGNNLDPQVAEVIAQGLARMSSRLKVLNLSKCHLDQSSILLIIRSLKDHATLLDLNLAGNMPDSSITSSAPPLDSAIFVEGSEGQAESSSTRNCCSKAGVVDYPLQGSCLGVGLQAGSAILTGEQVVNLPSNSWQERACSINVSSGGHQREEKTDADLHGDTAQSGLNNLRDGNTETISKEAADRSNQGPSGITNGIELVICPGRTSQMPRMTTDVADAEQRLRTGFCEENPIEEVPELPWNGEPVQPDSREVDSNNRETEIRIQPETKCSVSKAESFVADSTSGKGAHVFCDQLAASIRMAKGLQMLDLSDNHLEKKNVDLLFLAWSACARGRSVHQQHVDANTVHFFVETQPCPCSNPPCCTYREGALL